MAQAECWTRVRIEGEGALGALDGEIVITHRNLRSLRYVEARPIPT